MGKSVKADNLRFIDFTIADHSPAGGPLWERVQFFCHINETFIYIFANHFDCAIVVEFEKFDFFVLTSCVDVIYIKFEQKRTEHWPLGQAKL